MRFVLYPDLPRGAVRLWDDMLIMDRSRSFRPMVGDAANRKADAMIGCGNRLDRFVAIPFTLYKAESVLRLQMDERTVAIEGDHDIRTRQQQTSWHSSMDQQGLLEPLDLSQAGQMGPKTLSDRSRSGSYIDIERIGSLCLNYLEWMSSLDLFLMSIEPREYTAAMMHVDVGKHYDMNIGGSERCDAEMFREADHRMAFWDVHSSLQNDGWVLDPGALEERRPEERVMERKHLLVDTDGFSVDAEAIDAVRRSGNPKSVDVSDLDTDASVDWAVMMAVRGACIDPSDTEHKDLHEERQVIREVLRHQRSRLTPEEASDLFLMCRDLSATMGGGSAAALECRISK